MGYRIEVQTGLQESGDAVNRLAQQIDDENLMLSSEDAIPDGEWVAFEVKLGDGTVFFEGMGRCEGSAKTRAGWDVLLGALQLDTRNGLLYERIMLAKESLEDGKPTTGLHEIPEEHPPTFKSTPPPPLPSKSKPPPGKSLSRSFDDAGKKPAPPAKKPPVLKPSKKSAAPLPKPSQPAVPKFGPKKTLQGQPAVSRIEAPSWFPPHAKPKPKLEPKPKLQPKPVSQDTESSELPDDVAAHAMRTEVRAHGFGDMEHTSATEAPSVQVKSEKTEVGIQIPQSEEQELPQSEPETEREDDSETVPPGPATLPPGAPDSSEEDLRPEATAAVDLAALPPKVREGLITALPKLMSSGMARTIEEAHVLAVEVGLAALRALDKKSD